MASMLLCGAVSAQAHFEADAHAHDNNMPVVAQVVLDGEAVTTGGYELGAFIGDDVRGSAQIQTGLDNTYWIQVYYSTDTEATATVSFKLYDGDDEYTAETTLTIDPEGAGTPSDPVEIVVNRAVTQTTAMTTGWNWWSTPIELSNINGLEMLENALGESGSYIKSSTAYTRKRNNGTWGGSLESVGINNSTGYKVQTTGACDVSMVGALADPANHTITINNGWNWIGYPVNVAQSPNNALPSDFHPENNDQIKGQNGYARYRTSTGSWAPSSFRLEPGKSYLYNSSSSDTKTFEFIVGSRGEQLAPQNDTYWKGNYYVFPDNNSILAVVLMNGEQQRNDNIEIGAFVNGECRGSAKLEYDDYYDRYYAMFTVTGIDGEIIQFGMYNPDKGETSTNCETFLQFVTDDIVGDFEKPLEIRFVSSLANSSAITFPNPVDRNQTFSVSIPENEEIADLLIINALGAIIRHETGFIKTTSITGISVTGVYSVKVVCRSGNVYYNKLIVR